VERLVLKTMTTTALKAQIFGGKAALLFANAPAREWSRGDASDIDGQTEGRNERERMSQSLRVEESPRRLFQLQTELRMDRSFSRAFN
jgi:hypothetical protein